MNTTVDECLAVYEDPLREIKDPNTGFKFASVGVPHVVDFIFRELTDEVYDTLND